MKSKARQSWEDQRAKEKEAWKNRNADWFKEHGKTMGSDKPAAKAPASRQQADQQQAPKARSPRVGKIMKNPYYTPTKQSSFGETVGRFTQALLGQLFQ